MKIKANIYDFDNEKFNCVEIVINGETIVDIIDSDFSDKYILPGLIDSHVHIESSMLCPFYFGELAISKGVVSIVTDPHEISNVMGQNGFLFMLDNAKLSPLKIYFTVPSCVPATNFETSGFSFDSHIIEKLLNNDCVVGLSEMMNFPGVIYKDNNVMSKILVAQKVQKPIDGHAPGLVGDDLKKYISAGISTDHEAYTLEEAVLKIENGMMIQIREGSAAKNFETLWTLLNLYPDKVMLCTDDSHPDDMSEKYIDDLVRRAIKKGVSLKNIYKAAFFNPLKHYNLKDVGQLRIGDKADFIILDDIENFNINSVFINGKCHFVKPNFFTKSINISPINNFKASKISSADIDLKINNGSVKIMKAINGELITDFFTVDSKIFNGVSDIENDILKIVVINRYTENSKPVVGFINGFGLKKGAICSSIAHDSHNIIALGVNDNDIATAVNKLIEIKGGIVVADNEDVDFLQLDIAGLISSQKPDFVINKYKELNSLVKKFGSLLTSPFMTLSFMSLLVIPKLKIGDKGLFDVEKFKFVDLVE